MTKWEILVQKHPDKWAFIKNVKRNENGDIIQFDLMKVCSKAEKAKWLAFYMNGNEHFECIRTTFNAPFAGWLSL